MHTREGSIIKQLVGKRITLIDEEITGTILSITFNQYSNKLIIGLRVNKINPLSYKTTNETKRIELSFTAFMKCCKLHSLIK